MRLRLSCRSRRENLRELSFRVCLMSSPPGKREERARGAKMLSRGDLRVLKHE